VTSDDLTAEEQLATYHPHRGRVFGRDGGRAIVDTALAVEPQASNISEAFAIALRDFLARRKGVTRPAPPAVG